MLTFACHDGTAPGKRLTVITGKLQHDSNASFPSGDVVGATCFALALRRGPGACCAPAAAACVLLSAFGRMYWQAHHLLDVLVGGALAAGTCQALELLLGGASAAQWWHLGLAQLLVLVLAKALRAIPAAPPAHATPKARSAD